MQRLFDEHNARGSRNARQGKLKTARAPLTCVLRKTKELTHEQGTVVLLDPEALEFYKEFHKKKWMGIEDSWKVYNDQNSGGATPM